MFQHNFPTPWFPVSAHFATLGEKAVPKKQEEKGQAASSASGVAPVVYLRGPSDGEPHASAV
jgi:hypothetical protein